MVGMTEARQRAVITRFITNAQKAQIKEIAKGQKTLLDYVKKDRPPRKLAPGQKTLDYKPLETLPSGKPSLISKILGAKPLGPGKGPRVGGITPEGGVLNTLRESAKQTMAERGDRKRGLKFGLKSTMASIAGLLMLKKIFYSLEKSSGYLGAVFGILGKVFLMALMPIATILGAMLMPTALKLLDIFRGVLDILKGPMGDLIGGKIDVGEFIKIALPVISTAFINAGGVIADGMISMISTLQAAWPSIEAELIRAWGALGQYLEDNWSTIEPLITNAWAWIADRLEDIANLVIPLIIPGLIWAFNSIWDYLERNPEVKSDIIKILIGAAAIIWGPGLITGALGAITAIVISGAAALLLPALGTIIGTLVGWATFTLLPALGTWVLGTLIPGLVAVVGTIATALAPVIVPILLIVAIAYAIYHYWDDIKKIVIDTLTTVAEWGASFRAILDNMIASISNINLGGMIKTAVGNALKGIATGGKEGGTVGKIATVAAANTPMGAAAAAPGLISRVWKGVKSKLGFAKGGVVTKPTLGILGEAGPEAAIPLSKMGGMGGGSTNITVNVDANVSSDIDLDRLADQISAKIYDNVRRSTTW